jgi:hypothetical protein
MKNKPKIVKKSCVIKYGYAIPAPQGDTKAKYYKRASVHPTEKLMLTKLK